MAKYVGKRIVPKHCGVWNRTKAYEMLCIVYDQASGDSYISRKEVPAGTLLTNPDYWALCSDFSEQMYMLDQRIVASEAAIKADNDATEAAVKADNTATRHHADAVESSLNSRMDTIEARQAAEAAAATDKDADYAAEVVDARVGWDSQTYGSLGDAIRGQLEQGLKYAGYLSRTTSTEDLDDLASNTIYLVSSDAGETTLGHFPDYLSHGVLITTGQKDNFKYQIFYGGLGDRLFLRCHTSSGWRPWEYLFEDTEGEFGRVYNNLRLFGMEDILHKCGSFPSPATINGITFTHNQDGSITASGTADAEYPGFYNIFDNFKARPEGIEAGETYVFRLTGDTEKVYLQAYVDMEGTESNWTNFISTRGTAQARIPEGSKGLLIRVMVPPGQTVNGVTVYPSVTRKLTPEEYQQKNLKYAGDLARNVDTVDLNDLEVNTIYLISSSAGETTLQHFPDYGGHGVLLTAGTQGGYTYQLFFAEIPHNAFVRFRYGDGTWINWRNIGDVSGLSRRIHAIREQLFRESAGDMLYENLDMAQGEDSSGISFFLNDEGTITVSGTNVSGAYTFHNLLVKMDGLPSWQKAGETYISGIYDDTGAVSLHGYWLDNEDNWQSMFLPTRTFNTYKVPEEARGVLFRLEVAAGATVDTKVYPYVKRLHASNTMRYMGNLTREVDDEDMDNIPVNSIYLISSSAGETTLLNFPDYNGSGILITAGMEGAFTYQMLIGNIPNSYYLRFRYGSGTWADWRKVIDGSAISDDSRGTNPNSHMLSYGNSILSGSVWTDLHYNHLSEYYNAPYGVIANAIGIPKENVKHTVVSSTGLLYNAGQGSFLDNIKRNDLSDYDVVLTHLWTADMSMYPVGTENATAGDGTIAGGVVELVEYMKQSNGCCQLILVGVPPTSTSIYGDTVFTGKYGNGSSIAECDELMHKLAKKYHFVFVDWEELNLAYHFHDYSDGMNVHANNEDTYRIMGAYLGGRVSTQIRF